MSLRAKALLTLALVALVSLTASYFILMAVVLPVFSSLEDLAAEANLERVQRALEAQFGEVAAANQEWSVWDATVEFVQTRNASYVESSLGEAPGQYTGIDLFLFFDAQGSLVFGSLYDYAADQQLPLGDFRMSAIVPELLDLPTPDSRARGWVVTGRGPMMLSSAPIVGTNNVGPVAGVLIVGRWLTPARVDTVRQQSQVDVQIYQAETSALPEALQSVLGSLSSSTESIQVAANDNSLTTYQLLRDVGGAPAVLVEVRTFREMSYAGAQTVRLALAFLAVAGLVSLAVTWQLLKQIVVKPLTALTTAAADVSEHQDYAVRVRRHSQDEIGQLADAFNQMLGQIQERDQLVREGRTRAEDASRAKSAFLATMSHEIRTPMNGVVGMLDLLLRSPLTSTQEDYARTAVRSADNLMEIINDVLDFSKIGAGKLILEERVFQTRRLVEDAVGMFAESAEKKSLELTWFVDADVPHACVGDETRLRQILVNFLGNALKFTEQGEVVATVAVDAETGRVRFAVKDTGSGVDAEAETTIFAPFVQADSTVTRTHGGTGLGLAICKQLVDGMGGEIGLDSSVGEGSTFWFAVPLPDAPVDATTFDQPDVRDLQGLRVLVVDDNATNREILVRQTESWGMSVGAAEDGPSALRLLTSSAADRCPYDVAVLDMHMPGMSGLELAERVKASPAIRDLNMLMLTSLASDLDPREMDRLGIVRSLTKPAGHGRLRGALIEAVQDNPPQAAASSNRSPGDGPAAGSFGLHVLVVDDSAVNVKLTSLILKALGCQVGVATNGAEALDQLERATYDVVLMDCQMPIMDGYTATRAIRRREAEAGGDRIPILGFTANAFQSDRDACFAARDGRLHHQAGQDRPASRGTVALVFRRCPGQQARVRRRRLDRWRCGAGSPT